MYKLLVILQLAILSNLNAQTLGSAKSNEFVLYGQLKGRSDGTLVLWYPDTSGRYIRDTAYLQNGSFSFKGLISYPSFAHLLGSKNEGNRVSFFLDPAVQTIKLEENKFEAANIMGSHTQSLYQALNQKLTKLELRIKYLNLQKDSLETLRLEKGNQNANRQIEVLESTIENTSKAFDSVQNQFIQDHPDSYASATILLGVISRYPANLSRSLFNALMPEVRASRVGMMCDTELQKLERLTAGRYIPDFLLQAKDGKTLKLRDVKGKFILLDFWASWCIPCRQETPLLKRLYDRYHAKGLEIICLSLDTDKDAWERAISIDKMDHWIHIPMDREIRIFFEAIKFIPQKLLMDVEGKIIWSSLEDNDIGWEETMLQHLSH